VTRRPHTSFLKSLAVALLFCVTEPAHATFWDGNQLYKFLEADSRFQAKEGKAVTTIAELRDIHDAGMARGYIIAIYDAHEAADAYCIGPNVFSSQLVDTVRNYLQDHPETRNYRADQIVRDAITERFPCKGRPSKP